MNNRLSKDFEDSKRLKKLDIIILAKLLNSSKLF